MKVDLRELLVDLERYLDQRADCDHDGEGFVPNEAMLLHQQVEVALATLPSPAVLVAFDGLVFEDREHDLLCAVYDPAKHSLTGPIWQVHRMDRAYCQEEPEELLYSDYATKEGREWWAKHNRRTHA